MLLILRYLLKYRLSLHCILNCNTLKLSLIRKPKQKSNSLQTTAAKFCPEDGG